MCLRREQQQSGSPLCACQAYPKHAWETMAYARLVRAGLHRRGPWAHLLDLAPRPRRHAVEHGGQAPRPGLWPAGRSGVVSRACPAESPLPCYTCSSMCTHGVPESYPTLWSLFVHVLPSGNLSTWRRVACATNTARSAGKRKEAKWRSPGQAQAGADAAQHTCTAGWCRGPAQEVWLARQQLRALDIVPWPQPQHLVSCQHLLHNLLHSLQNMQHDAPQCVSAWLMHVAWMPHR